jgi:hypothetical protein
MTAAQLLDKLRDKGVSVRAEHGRLKCRAPREIMSEVQAGLEEHREELLELLAAPAGPPVNHGLARLRSVCRSAEHYRPFDLEDKKQFFKGDWRAAWPYDFKVYKGDA